MAPVAAAADAWLAWLAAVSWQVALVAAVIGVADRLLGQRLWPQLRHGLWLLVAIKLVLPPGLPSLLRPAQVIAQGSPASISAAGDAAGPPWSVVALGAWMLVAAALAGAGARRSARFRASLQAGSMPAPRSLQALADDLARRLGLVRPVPVRVVSDLRSPLVVGLRRPVAFVPARALERWSARALEHVLCHEIAHVRRRDLWTEAAFSALATVYWFHPAVWWARRQAHAIREMCCDATAAASSGPGYRETLLRVSADALLAPAGAGITGLRSRRDGMLARLRALQHTAPATPRRRMATAALLVAAALALLPLAARRLGPDLEAQIGAARQELARALSDAPGAGSLHVRYGVMQLQALEDRRAARHDPADE